MELKKQQEQRKIYKQTCEKNQEYEKNIKEK